MCRRLAREEGLFLGYSAGSAFAGLLQLGDKLTKDDIVVVIIHDHGSRYVGKIYNDDWMRERGFLDRELRVGDLVAKKSNTTFITVKKVTPVKEALEVMRSCDISQMPVMQNGEIIGSLTQSDLLSFILENPLKNMEKTVSNIMGKPFPVVSNETLVKDLNRYITKSIPAVIAKDKAGTLQVVTQYDIIQAV